MPFRLTLFLVYHNTKLSMLCNYGFACSYNWKVGQIHNSYICAIFVSVRVVRDLCINTINVGCIF